MLDFYWQVRLYNFIRVNIMQYAFFKLFVNITDNRLNYTKGEYNQSTFLLLTLKMFRFLIINKLYQHMKLILPIDRFIFYMEFMGN